MVIINGSRFHDDGYCHTVGDPCFGKTKRECFPDRYAKIDEENAKRDQKYIDNGGCICPTCRNGSPRIVDRCQTCKGHGILYDKRLGKNIWVNEYGMLTPKRLKEYIKKYPNDKQAKELKAIIKKFKKENKNGR